MLWTRLLVSLAATGAGAIAMGSVYGSSAGIGHLIGGGTGGLAAWVLYGFFEYQLGSRQPPQTAEFRKLQSALARQIRKTRKGKPATLSIGPTGRLHGQCSEFDQWLVEHGIPRPPLEDGSMVMWHDLLSALVPMIESNRSKRSMCDRAIECLTRSE